MESGRNTLFPQYTSERWDRSTLSDWIFPKQTLGFCLFGFLPFVGLGLPFFLTTLVSQMLQGPAVLMENPEVEWALCYICTRGKWLLPQRAPWGRVTWVVARRVARVTLVCWRQSQDNDETMKVRQNFHFPMFFCLTFSWQCLPFKLVWKSVFEMYCWMNSVQGTVFVSYHISRYLSFLIKILTFRYIKHPVKIS